MRSWREQRHLSQLDLASEAEISQKHLSFIESGRSAPSREMVLRLSEHLDIPLRERNTLLMAAGFAPVFRDRPLDDPALKRARTAIDLRAEGARALSGADRRPALDDGCGQRISRAAAGRGRSAASARPVNVMRVSLHPRGLAPLIVNLAEWRAHLMDRLRRQFRITRDPVIDALLKELSGYRIGWTAGGSEAGPA